MRSRGGARGLRACARNATGGTGDRPGPRAPRGTPSRARGARSLRSRSLRRGCGDACAPHALPAVRPPDPEQLARGEQELVRLDLAPVHVAPGLERELDDVLLEIGAGRRAVPPTHEDLDVEDPARDERLRE